jgi:hypothetical protein
MDEMLRVRVRSHTIKWRLLEPSGSRQGALG